jgi:hypothetical protein
MESNMLQQPQHFNPPAPQNNVPAGAAAHMERLPINTDGTVVECVILKRYDNGDRVFIRVDHLDNIDRERIKMYLSERYADKFHLWDLLSNRRLGNGMNALEYFHQMAKYYVKQTSSVRHLNPAVSGSSGTGVMGAGHVIG